MMRKFSSLPSVESLLRSDLGEQLQKQIPRPILVNLARQAVARVRDDLASGAAELQDGEDIPARVIAHFAASTRDLLTPTLKKVINCTGIILHTGLGRAVLSPAAIKRMQEIAGGYVNLEFDLATGRRGDRTAHVEQLLCTLTGAEAACVVNNNAAAIFLALNTLANRKEVIVSRGELIEIGGSFRIPEIMAKSGAKMVEVGTTNKTHRRDFTNAITPRTAGILQVHPSNYRVAGFTASVPLAEIVAVARQHDLFVLHDLGGGVLADLRQYGLPREPVVAESLRAGADVVTFSGDKVLGGPQSGLLVGGKEHIGRIKKNPMMRVLRCDKLTFALLHETLRLFLQPSRLLHEHTVLRMFTTPAAELKQRAESVLQRAAPIDACYEVEVVESAASAGSGALPLEPIPSVALAIGMRRGSIHSLARRLRQATPAIVGYTRQRRLYLDLRTVLPQETAALAGALRAVLSPVNAANS